MNLLTKLLRYRLSFSQLAGFFFSNLAGMLIILVSIQLWWDIRPFFEGEDRFIKKDYLIVTKKVGTLSILNKQGNDFSEAEIEEIARQPFTTKAGAFLPSRFPVTASVGMESSGIYFSTEMFFESVPDEYIDVNTPSWQFSPESDRLPIILPKTYLNLYNFGFAQSRNLPKLSEQIIGMVDLDIHIRGKNGQHKQYKGNIVGFSERLNTILVPEQFIKWANRNFAGEEVPRISRLIVETANPADKRISRFFKEHGYEVENNKLDAGNTMWFLNVITGIVMGIGVLICILSFYILILSIYLILQKDSYKLENLLLMGYSVRQVSVPYQRFTFIINGSILVISFVVLYFVRSFYASLFEEIWQAYTPATFYPAGIAGICLFIGMAILNGLIIRKRIRKLRK